MRRALTHEMRQRIEGYVDELLRDLEIPDDYIADGRADFILHLETETRAQIERGLRPEEALEKALEQFGDAKRIRAQLRSWARSARPRSVHALGRGTALAEPHSPIASIAGWIEDLLQDVRFAARSIRLQRSFTATVVMTIAIGIAATTTIFSVVDGILLRPLPYPEPDRIMAIWPTFWFSNAIFEIFEQDLLGTESSAFSAVAGYSPRNAWFGDEDEGTRSIKGIRVTAGFFEVLGPRMELGRTFEPDANELGNEKVVVVANRFWQSEFGGDRSIVGQTITLEGEEHVVIGVLAPDYDLLRADTDVVLPKVFDRDHVRFRSAEMKVLGRWQPGTTIPPAQAGLQSIIAAWKERYGAGDDFGADFTVVSLRESVVGAVRPTLLLLFGSVGLILLIASSNVVNLLLTRGIARQREISVRLALGAKGSRIVRQLVTESTVLALLGGAIGLMGSALAVRGVVALLPHDTPRLDAIEVDARVAGFALALALVTGWLVSIVPALRLAAVRLRDSLASGGRGATGRSYVRRAIVAAEVGLAVMLLIGAGLLVKSFWHLSRVDAGIRTEGLVTFYVGAERGRLTSHAEAEVFHRSVLERIEALPGVARASTISQAPYNQDGGVVGCRRFEDAAPEADNENQCRWRSVGPNYFAVAETSLVAGRVFRHDDTEGSAPVAIISSSAARALFPAGDGIGGRVATGFESTVEDGLPWATVIGIAADVRFLGLAEQAPLLVYRPAAQTGAIADRFGFYGREYMVRGEPDAAALTTVREAVRAAAPDGVVSGYAMMQQLVANSVSDRRAILILMSTFTAAAVFLATIGIYGITAHGVRARSRELSIRVALGASDTDITTEVLAGGFKVASAGALAGLAAALIVARWIDSFLYEVAGTDPWVVVSAPVMVLAVSVAATWLPARRAAAADPVGALGTE